MERASLCRLAHSSPCHRREQPTCGATWSLCVDWGGPPDLRPRLPATKQPHPTLTYDAATPPAAPTRAPCARCVERATGLEPATFSLGSGMAWADRSGQRGPTGDRMGLEVTGQADNVCFRVPRGV